MKLILGIVVMVAGAISALQLGMNAQLRHSFGHGTVAALVNFTIGTLALAGFVLLARLPIPTIAQVSAVPAWAWLGGLCGAVIVTTTAIAGRELGALSIAALVVSGQLVMSVVLDHFGWFGFPVKPFTMAKAIGCVLLVVSLVLFKES